MPVTDPGIPETRHWRTRKELAPTQLEQAQAERERLRTALTEACDWLDADLAHAPDTPTAMADRELVASWRAALGEAENKKPPCLFPLSDGRRCCECESCQDAALGEADDE